MIMTYGNKTCYINVVNTAKLRYWFSYSRHLLGIGDEGIENFNFKLETKELHLLIYPTSVITNYYNNSNIVITRKNNSAPSKSHASEQKLIEHLNNAMQQIDILLFDRAESEEPTKVLRKARKDLTWIVAYAKYLEATKQGETND